MQLKIKKKEGPHFLGNLEQLSNLGQYPSKDKLVVGGALLMAALEPVMRGQPEWVMQPNRSTQGNKLLTKPGAKTIYLALSKEALGLLSKVRSKVVFEHDVLLKYGFRVKADELLVLSLFEAPGGCQLTMLQFKKQELVSIQEFELPGTVESTYEVDLLALLERIQARYGQAAIHWAGPAELPPGQILKKAPTTIWATGPQQVLTKSGKPGFMRRHGIAMALILLSLGGAAGALYLPYTQYAKAKAALATENALLQGEYTFASDKLNLLRARQGFLTNRSKAGDRLGNFESVLQALAVQPGLKLASARLFDEEAKKTTGGQPADFEVMVFVEKDPELSALSQSKPLLEKLSDEMGLGLRLSTVDAYREQTNPKGKPQRMYRIQGDFRAS